MASRESFSIKNYWKYIHNVPTKYVEKKYDGLMTLNPFVIFYLRCYSVGSLFLKVLRGTKSWERHYFWQDSFRQPFYKYIGCKFIKHEWFYMGDQEEAFCLNCHKHTERISQNQWDRMEKLKSIKKRIKK